MCVYVWLHVCVCICYENGCVHLQLLGFCIVLFEIVDATIYVGGLDEKVTDAVLWELFLQAGPVGKQAAAATAQIFD